MQSKVIHILKDKLLFYFQERKEDVILCKLRIKIKIFIIK